MVKGTCWALVILAGCGIAQAAPGRKSVRQDRWDAVETLKPGMEIDVLAGSAAGPGLCLLSSVNDSTLTCLSENSATDIRLVFPRTAVRELWGIEAAPNRHGAAWIGTAILTGLAIAASVAEGPAGLAVALFIAMPVLALAEAPPAPWPGMLPPPLPPPPRVRQRLVYRRATP